MTRTKLFCNTLTRSMWHTKISLCFNFGSWEIYCSSHSLPSPKKEIIKRQPIVSIQKQETDSHNEQAQPLHSRIIDVALEAWSIHMTKAHTKFNCNSQGMHLETKECKNWYHLNLLSKYLFRWQQVERAIANRANFLHNAPSKSMWPVTSILSFSGLRIWL